jgi:hypothetical protein
MRKVELHKRDLAPLFGSFSRTGHPDALTGYLVGQSNLPGRRANLELARAFADSVASCAAQDAGQLWALCQQMASLSPEEAPANDPHEFIPFCGTTALGALGAAYPRYAEPALQTLHKLANDPRWRLREAVSFGLQRLLAAETRQTVDALHSWIPVESWLELRAVAAAVAEPTLLQDQDLARSALRLHQRILERVQEAGDRDRKTEPFRILRKGLGYTPSVVVQALPDEGFVWLAQLANSQDRDVLWIVRQNLKKNRLVREFPIRVEQLMETLRRET